MKKTQIYDVYEQTLAYAKECKNQAFIDYKEARKEVTAWRSIFQDSLMAAQAEQNNTLEEMEIKKGEGPHGIVPVCDISYVG
jgi:hypothetical protein